METNEIRIGELESRVVTLEEKINALITITKSTHELLNGIAKLANDNFEKLDHGLKDVQKSLNDLNTETSSNFQAVDSQLGSVNNQLGSVNNQLGSVNDQLGSIEGELKKINTATGYEEQYNNLKIVSRN